MICRKKKYIAVIGEIFIKYEEHLTNNRKHQFLVMNKGQKIT